MATLCRKWCRISGGSARFPSIIPHGLMPGPILRSKQLWAVRFTTKPEIAEALSDALGDSLSLSILCPPRSIRAQIEAIYGEKPDPADLTARLSVAAALHKIKPPKFEIREMPSLDWLKKVAEDFPPLPIGRWIIHGARHRKAV